MRCPILWKEWRQQRWLLVFSTVMLIGAIGSLAAAHIISEREVAVILYGAAAFALPLFSAMGAFAPEHTGGTFTFYASRPAGPFRVFFAKWFFGLMNTVLPVLAAFVFTLVVARQPVTELLGPTVFEDLFLFIFFGMIFYNMTCCFAPSKSRAEFVGLIGLLVLLMMFLYPLAMTYWIENEQIWDFAKPQHPVVEQIIMSVSPMIWLFDQPSGLLYRFQQCVIFIIVFCFGYWKWRRMW
ncbi:MAG TPA: hypothetical protein VLH60_01950 [Sedimentisphaerales bacterium]|nr:hypothetical protein [Sedimentisphaerales bacterium]